VAYAAQKGQKWCVVSDGQPGTDYDQVGEPAFSPDGRHVAYAAQKGQKWCVVSDGQPGPDYDNVEQLPVLFGPDGRLAYVVAGEYKRFVVVQGVAGPDYAEIEWLGFSADGKHLTYTARRKKFGDYCIVMDGVEAADHYDSVPRLAFSPDWKRRECIKTKSKGKSWVNTVVVDGRAEPGHDNVSGPLSFSHDGKHLMYLAYDNEKETVVIDGQASAKYDQIGQNRTGPWSPDIGELAFRPDGSVAFLAARQGVVYCVRYVPSPK
jgi:hypothetical protein